MKVTLVPNLENNPGIKNIRVIPGKSKIQLNVNNRILKRQVQTIKDNTKNQLNKMKSTPPRSQRCNRKSNGEPLSERYICIKNLESQTLREKQTL
jgi:hypothetical protein